MSTLERQQKNSNGVIILTLVGLVIAVGIFLTVMFNSSRAKTPNRYNNFVIPIPSIPSRPTIKPVLKPTPLDSPTPSLISTPSASTKL